MKVASRGPIVRWSLRKPVAGNIISRNDWKSGRDLSNEERSSGLLLRISDIQKIPKEGNYLPIAVVKAQPSDYQVNEMDSNGTIATLEKTPKGKWRKISRQKTLLVEDNSRTPFSDPTKTFSPRVQNYGEYTKLLGKMPRDSPILQFVIYRDSHSLKSVENRMGYTISLQQECIFLHSPPGGSFGCITQHGFCLGMTKELLPHASRHYNLHPLIFDPKEYHTYDRLKFLLKKPSGHFFRILLRCVEGDRDSINNRLKFINDNGFINYFGIDKFGVGANRFYEIASFAAKGDFHQAVGAVLQSIAEYDGVHHDYFLQYLNADPSTLPGISKSWVDAAKHMRSQKWLIKLLEGLANYHAGMDHHQDYLRKLWESIPIIKEIRNSAAEFIWNAMASQRLLSKGLKVVEGDVVRVKEINFSTFMGDNSSNSYNYKIVTSEEVENNIYRITDVVLPVPYGSSIINNCLFPNLTPLNQQFYQEFAERHNISFLFKETLEPSIFPKEIYRPLVVKPIDLQVAVIKDPNSYTSLKSDLSVMQEHKPIQTMEMDYVLRVREPCVYNVSERFVERMNSIKKKQSGENSVIISCLLPESSSPFVMLRESFSLRYASFHDLYGLL